MRSGQELFGGPDGGPVDAGPEDGGVPPVPRCDWSWGQAIGLREFPTAFVADLAFDWQAPRLRVVGRAEGSAARRVWIIDTADFAVVDILDPNAGVDPARAQLFGLDGVFLEVIPRGNRCLVRTLERVEAELDLRRTSRRPDCFAFAGGPNELVVAAVDRDLSYHAIGGRPFEQRAAVGPFPRLAGETFAWRRDGAFRGVRLAPGGGIEEITVTGGLTREFLGNSDPLVQFAPDPDRDRAFLLESRGDDTASLGVAQLGDSRSLNRFPGGVTYVPDPSRAIPIAAGELLIVEAESAVVGFVPTNGETPAFLEPPEPRARDLRLASQPTSDRAAAIYGVPNDRGGATLVVRELDCRR